jgi:hypothetical protein
MAYPGGKGSGGNYNQGHPMEDIRPTAVSLHFLHYLSSFSKDIRCFSQISLPPSNP